ncbi:MAG TPA: EAL domain-containing protein [Ilumatobacter sp.]|nr:EAL domain-containing protein [Ilumatobacter sp.]
MRRDAAAPMFMGAVSAALVCTYLIAPARQSTEVIAAVGPLLAGMAAVAAAVVGRPDRGVAWSLVGVGLVMFGVARFVAASEWFDGTPMQFPDAYSAVLALGLPSLVIGTMATRTPRRFRDFGYITGIKPVMYAVVATAIIWLTITQPYFADNQAHGPDWLWFAVPSLIEYALAFVVYQRISSKPAFRFTRIAATVGVTMAVTWQAIFAWSRLTGRFEPGGFFAACGLIASGVIAVTVCLPKLRDAMGGDHTMAPAARAQLVTPLVASVVPLALLVVVLGIMVDSPQSATVVGVAVGLTVLLAILEARRIEREVRELVDGRGVERLAAMVEHSSDVVLLSDGDGHIAYASPGVMSMLGFTPLELIDQPLLSLVAEPGRAPLQADFERLANGQLGQTIEFETSLTRNDGQLRTATAVIANQLGGTAVDGMVTTFRDVTEQRNLERQLSHRAFHDELTGLANRALFLDRMDHALRVARSETDPVVVLFVDLDDFKAVNDSYGHAVGDSILQSVAARIRRSAGTGDTVARLGGDEFAILLEDRGGVDRAINVAEALIDELSEPVEINGNRVSVLASVGVAVAAPGLSTSSLLRDADVAMYEAKRAGKGQIRIFDPAMRLVASKHLAYRGQLGAALDNGELRLVYMPYVDLRTGQVTGAEALVRWHHPEFGEIPAADFIPIAERSGLIVPMGNWIFDQGLSLAATWQQNLGLYISFNVSPIQIKHPDFIEDVRSAVTKHGVDPRLVMLEVNESVLADETARMKHTFRELSEFGVRFAVDDFGSGSASLNYVQRYPVSLVKIDSSAVEEFGNDPRGNTLARVIVQMAESLKITTVAEGVESTRQLNALRRLGCDLGQGYVLSHPIEAAEISRRFGGALPATIS